MLEAAAFPGDATAYREYAVGLPSGGNATIAFTLGKPENDGPPATIARELDAVAFGFGVAR
jgi:hypothetical protein